MEYPKTSRKVNTEVIKSRQEEPCWICNRMPSDASHIKTRGSGGPDELWNVVSKCRIHHIEWGYGWSKFLRKYPGFAFRLKMLGWSWESGRLRHPLLHGRSDGL